MVDRIVETRQGSRNRVEGRISLGELVRVCQAYDAVKHGGFYKGRWGNRVFDHIRNPYSIVANWEERVKRRK